MTIKFLAVIGVVIAGFFAFQQLRSTRNIDEALAKGRIRIAAEAAKAKNQREITVPAPIGIYAQVTNLDQALANYTTVIARTVSKHSYLTTDSKEIATWYKFEVIDFLSQPRTARCSSCPSLKTMPTEIAPINDNEIVVVRNVGTVIVDDVKVTSISNNFPEFQLKQQYLLFISVDLNTRVGSIELGPAGVSIVEGDGEISPASSTANKLNSELRKRFGKIEKVKAALQFRRFPEL